MTIKKMPSRGEMKFRITIEQKTNTPIANRGGVTPGPWVTYAQLWCFFDPWKGKKVIKDQQVAQYMVLRCVVARFLDADGGTVTSDMRVNYEGRIFNIEAIYDVAERHEYQEMYLTEGVTV